MKMNLFDQQKYILILQIVIKLLLLLLPLEETKQLQTYCTKQIILKYEKHK